MTAALEAPGSFLEASWKFHEQKRNNKFIKVRCVEHGERICATAALADLWEEFQNFPEAFWKLSGSKTVLEGRWPTQRPGASDFTGLQHAWTTCSGTSGWTELFEVLIWFDFMLNFITPLASIETNTMFFGSARIDVIVLGVLVFQFSLGQNTWLYFPDLPALVF